MTGMRYEIGILFLADVVNYTTQANKLGSEKTDTFNRHLKNKVIQLTEKHHGKFIKPGRDSYPLRLG